jgi:hypothetical protein
VPRSMDTRRVRSNVPSSVPIPPSSETLHRNRLLLRRTT